MDLQQATKPARITIIWPCLPQRQQTIEFQLIQRPDESGQNPSLYTLHCVMVIAHFTLFTLHYSLYTVHVKLFTVHCTLYTVHRTVYTVHCSLYTVHCTPYSVHCTLFTVHCTLYTAKYADKKAESEPLKKAAVARG